MLLLIGAEIVRIKKKKMTGSKIFDKKTQKSIFPDISVFVMLVVFVFINKKINNLLDDGVHEIIPSIHHHIFLPYTSKSTHSSSNNPLLGSKTYPTNLQSSSSTVRIISIP
jgi:hypothetical protein